MGVKEAITQLEIIATNMIGRLCVIPNEDERQIALLNKQIEALDMGIDALKTQIDLVRCGECEYADEYNHCKYSAWWNGNADFCSHGIRRKENR